MNRTLGALGALSVAVALAIGLTTTGTSAQTYYEYKVYDGSLGQYKLVFAVSPDDACQKTVGAPIATWSERRGTGKCADPYQSPIWILE